MLVLNRKQNQAIRFPNLGISIRVCRVAGNAVRLGIEAPRDVIVVRDELCQASADSKPLQSELRHRRRNQLNAARVALALAQKQLECGQAEEAELTLAKAVSELERLDQQFNPSAVPQASKNDDTVDSDAGRREQRALIVEDNDNERELLAGYLRLSGFKVDTASNGLEAINHLSKSADNLPQAVVLDMKMPQLDGAKTVSTLRFQSETRDLKLFAVSGASPSEMNIAVGPGGVNRWFLKPVNPAALVQQINAELGDTTPPGYVWPLGVIYDPARCREAVPA